MRNRIHGLTLLVLAGAGVPAVNAQDNANFRVPPNGANQECRVVGARNIYGDRGENYVAVRSDPNHFRVAPQYNNFQTTNPYGGYSSPYGGFMSGTADVINSQGQVAVSVEQARQVHEQTRQMKIDTKRKAFDEYLYERKLRPTAEDERERGRIESLRRARNNPPSNEIWSGSALNTLLLGIQQMNAQGMQGPPVPLDEAMLRNINVTSGANVGSLGLLRNEGKLQWPLVLRGSAFGSDRTKMDQLAAQAYSQAQSGQVNDDTMQGLIDGVDNLQKQLKSRVDVVDANSYIKGKRYLNEFENTVKALQSPNVTQFASGKWAARGNTVPELVQNMTRDGLKFAPAVMGQEPYYTALHSALVAYYQLPQAQAWDTLAK